MKYRITTYLTILGTRKVVELSDSSYGQWIVYEKGIPIYKIDVFDINSEVTERLKGIMDNITNNKIEPIIKKINKIHNRKLSLNNKPTIGIKIKSNLEEVEIKNFPVYLFESVEKGVPNNTYFYKEYSFSDWTKLDEKIKREIINHYWDPFNADIGFKTRQEIINSFKASLKSELEYCKYRYFGFYAEAIFVIPKDNKTHLPKEYAGLTINRGKKIKDLGNDIWQVKWTHSGKEEVKLN